MHRHVMKVALLSPVATSNEVLYAQLSGLRKNSSPAQVEAALLSPEISWANVQTVATSDIVSLC